MEPPLIPDGYGISVAYGCLLDIVRSISLAIQGPSKLGEQNSLPHRERTTEDEKNLHTQLIQSSWCGLLAALTPLIDATTDESLTENILKAMQNYASLCGILGEARHQTRSSSKIIIQFPLSQTCIHLAMHS